MAIILFCTPECSANQVFFKAEQYVGKALLSHSVFLRRRCCLNRAEASPTKLQLSFSVVIS